MNPPSRPTHAVLIEPKTMFVLGYAGGSVFYREEPLAYFALPTGVELEGDGWTALEDRGATYLVGDDAIQVADRLAGCGLPSYPLAEDSAAGGGGDGIGWLALGRLVEALIGKTGSARVITLAPSTCRHASNLWLHALPETLIADVQPDYQVVSAPRLLADAPTDDERSSPWGWSWVLGEVGVSIAVTCPGRYSEEFVSRQSASTFGEPALDRYNLIEQCLGATVSMNRASWADAGDRIRFRLTAPAWERTELEPLICRALAKFGLGDRVRAEFLGVRELLGLAVTQDVIDCSGA